MTMKTSSRGRAAIMQREGCRLNAYRDSVGVLTIGVGHTGRASPPHVHAGMHITTAQADAYLAADLAPFEEAVNHAVKRPLTQNQFDACVSLAFNIGGGGFTGSGVVHRINAGDMEGAANAFLMWERPPALAGRRQEERKQFLTPDEQAAPVAAAA